MEILLATTAPLVSSYRQFRVINLPEIMMKTMADYVNHDDYLNLWLSRVGAMDSEERDPIFFALRRL